MEQLVAKALKRTQAKDVLEEEEKECSESDSEEPIPECIGQGHQVHQMHHRND